MVDPPKRYDGSICVGGEHIAKFGLCLVDINVSSVEYNKLSNRV